MLGKLKKLVDVCTPCKDVQSVNTKIVVKQNCCVKTNKVLEMTINCELKKEQLKKLEELVNEFNDPLNDDVF